MSGAALPTSPTLRDGSPLAQTVTLSKAGPLQLRVGREVARVVKTGSAIATTADAQSKQIGEDAATLAGAILPLAIVRVR